MNAILFLMFYDLYKTIGIVKKCFCKKNIILHGFSGGGQVIQSYVSIVCFNKILVKDICKVVNTSNLYKNELSPELKELIKKYTNNEYTFENVQSPVKLLVLNYPYTDLTIRQQPQSFSQSSLFSALLNSTFPEAVGPLTLLFSNKLYSDGVSNPVTFEAKYSLIEKNYPPTYIVHTFSDPIIQNTIPNLFCAWLNSKNVPNVKQSFSFGGHGFGMGFAFSDFKTYPPNQYPNNFENKYYTQFNTFYGSDSVNGNYPSSNSSNWFQSPYTQSNHSLSLNEFVKKYVC